MKKLLLILLCLPMIGFGQDKSPCLDERYIELKKKDLDNMSDREYQYFSKKEDQCNQYMLSNKGLSDNLVLGADKNINVTYGKRESHPLKRRQSLDLYFLCGFYGLTSTISLITDVASDGVVNVPMMFLPVIGPFFVAADDTKLNGKPLIDRKSVLPLILIGVIETGFLVDYILTSKKIRVLRNDNMSYHINPNPLAPSLTFVYNFD